MNTKLTNLKEQIASKLDWLFSLSYCENILDLPNLYLSTKELDELKVFINTCLLKNSLERFDETKFFWSHNNPDWLANRDYILREIESLKFADANRMEYLARTQGKYEHSK